MVREEQMLGGVLQGGPLTIMMTVAGCRELRPTSPATLLPHRGTFYQGYLCTRCGVGAHKECLEVMPPCKMSE